jgi:putative ABC transport system permease protein
MLRSFLVITFRILWRNKVTSFVNIFSLGVGITAFIFIMLYVQHETSYDKFNANFDRIYRLEGDQYGKLPPVLGMHLKDKLPEVENVAFLAMGFKNSIGYTPDGSPGNLKQIEVNRVLADSTTFDVFTFPFVQGDPRTALQHPMSIVLSESTAKKLFGERDPMGKMVVFELFQFMVTGIMHDVKMSHIEIDVLVSLSSWPTLFPNRNINLTGPNSWAWSATYLLMNDAIDEMLVENKINKALSEINDGKLIDTEFKKFQIRPFRDLYFEGETQKLPYGLHGNLKAILVLVAIGIFLLVLAGINYVNLTTARSTIRSKEIAVKRVTGSSVSLLRSQLIGESVIISLVSLVFALTIVQLFLSKFNELTSVNIQIVELNRPWVWSGIIGGGVLIGILAGLYPAFYLTAIQPARLIKGAGVRGSEGSFFRNWLMTFQFALSIVMIVAIIVNIRQLNYLRTADLGFKKEEIVFFDTPTDIPNEFEFRNTFKTNLLQNPAIKNVTFSYGNPGIDISDSPTFEINGTHSSMKLILVDSDYLNVTAIPLSQGRGFSMDSPSDQIHLGNRVPGTRVAGVILNEAAVREFGMDNPIGQMIYTLDSNRFQFEVIGITKDFHFRSLHDKIEPLMLAWNSDPGKTASIRIAPSNIPATLKTIETEFKQIWGQVPFNYHFLDETFARQYQRDEHLAKIIGYFTVLAMIIACLGLFGLSSFMVSRRTKEIGVRKTMGASVGTIYSMLSWDFLKWILVAIIFACPVAWYLMHLWLETFAYHITIGADVFVFAALLAVAIAMLTVTAQSLKMAKANPIDSLRYE